MIEGLGWSTAERDIVRSSGDERDVVDARPELSLPFTFESQPELFEDDQ